MTPMWLASMLVSRINLQLGMVTSLRRWMLRNRHWIWWKFPEIWGKTNLHPKKLSSSPGQLQIQHHLPTYLHLLQYLCKKVYKNAIKNKDPRGVPLVSYDLRRPHIIWLQPTSSELILPMLNPLKPWPHVTSPCDLTADLLWPHLTKAATGGGQNSPHLG